MRFKCIIEFHISYNIKIDVGLGCSAGTMVLKDRNATILGGALRVIRCIKRNYFKPEVVADTDYVSSFPHRSSAEVMKA